jgi:hypothetical protein
MHPSLAEKRAAIAAICQRFGVRRLDVFGSAARGTDFDPARSDVDFLVEFDTDPRSARLADWLDLKSALEAVVGRSVDLVEQGTLRNPFVRADIDRSRQPLYGA